LPAGSVAASACLCDLGYSPASGACAPFAAGSYKAAQGSAACELCRSNATSGVGSVSEDACKCKAGCTEFQAILYTCAGSACDAKNLSGVDGWRLVRLLSAGHHERWHQSADFLIGTAVYGGTIWHCSNCGRELQYCLRKI